MNNTTITFGSKQVCGEVQLPASKSISNRVLIIHALTDSDLPIENLSDCEDTNSMLRVLRSETNRFDVGHAGTAMRFLTAYLSRIIGCWEITGSERMKQRPVAVLVDALNSLGAKIEYLESKDCPPLRIYGSRLVGGKIDMSASVSSQYVSALMMIAPSMEKGLTIRLDGKIVSRTYINMTLQIMRAFGADVTFCGNVITVAPLPYTPVAYRVESDWSAASYFYELLAIAGSGEIRLPGLKKDSTQGDAGQIGLWEKLGVVTRFEGETVILCKKQPEVTCLEYDFVEMPDLVQSFAVACCMLEIPFVFSGVETLRIKETDRIKALMTELAKLGYTLEADGDNRILWNGICCEPAVPEIATYHDHRMAMAFAPAALKYPGLIIIDKEVVCKSFPGYWLQLQKLNIIIS